jgi:hypothetical protein
MEPCEAMPGSRRNRARIALKGRPVHRGDGGLADLMADKQKDDDARAKVLDGLTAESRELGMGY